MGRDGLADARAVVFHAQPYPVGPGRQRHHHPARLAVANAVRDGLLGDPIQVSRLGQRPRRLFRRTDHFEGALYPEKSLRLPAKARESGGQAVLLEIDRHEAAREAAGVLVGFPDEPHDLIRVVRRG
jgi:hypothetical protein